MSNEMKNLILEEIEASEMILVGLGEEFDQRSQLLQNEDFKRKENKLKENKKEWLIPALMQESRLEMGITISEALDNLLKLLGKKNYYIISTSLSDEIRSRSWLRNHLVMPLGDAYKYQCSEECDNVPKSMNEEERKIVSTVLRQELDTEIRNDCSLGICPLCGRMKRSNTVYLYDEYDERGYQDEWKRYTNWLQLTLNHKVLLMELGVGLDYPGVIRWPFEKIASINQQSRLCRIHSSLYHLPEGLAQKGISVHENAIAWLERL